MSDYSYVMLLQAFTPMHILLHIHVLTCMNVPVSVVNLFYTIMHHTCITCMMITICLIYYTCYVKTVYFSSYGTILSLIAYHLPS